MNFDSQRTFQKEENMYERREAERSMWVYRCAERDARSQTDTGWPEVWSTFRAARRSWGFIMHAMGSHESGGSRAHPQ